MARGRKPKKQSEGLGDTIDKITEATGIKTIVKAIAGNDCGCEERRKKLNEKYSYRLKVVNCPTDEQIQWYKDFATKRTLTISNEQRKTICEYYSKIFGLPYFEPCTNCSPKPYIQMIQKLDEVFNN
jgi:hypothetical protein